MSPHLNQDDLLDRLYGLGESGIAHLRECPECTSRFEALERRRTEVVAEDGAESPVSNEFLVKQRRAIYHRLDQAPAVAARWAQAALGVAFLLVMGVFLVRPHPQNHPVLPPDPALGVKLSE